MIRYFDPLHDDVDLNFHQVSVEELPCSLELLRYGLYFCPVMQEFLDGVDTNTGITKVCQTFGLCWSLEKVAFRIAEDFGCADWTSLLRWHESSGVGPSGDTFRGNGAVC